MTRGEQALRLRRPRLPYRLWARRMGQPEPILVGVTRPLAQWCGMWVALLVPYPWRPVHHAYASWVGFFWKPCPLCGRPFGGHEAGGSVPDPLQAPFGGLGICSACTRARSARQGG